MGAFVPYDRKGRQGAVLNAGRHQAQHVLNNLLLSSIAHVSQRRTALRSVRQAASCRSFIP